MYSGVTIPKAQRTPEKNALLSVGIDQERLPNDAEVVKELMAEESDGPGKNMWFVRLDYSGRDFYSTSFFLFEAVLRYCKAEFPEVFAEDEARTRGLETSEATWFYKTAYAMVKEVM